MSGLLSSNNSFPSEIWDGITMWSREDFNLVYVPDSAVYRDDTTQQERPLVGNAGLFTDTGVLLGAEGSAGEIETGKWGWVMFKIRPQFAGES